MGLWNILTGQPEPGQDHRTRIEKAVDYMREGSSVAGHYSMEAARNSVRQWTDVKDLTISETIEAVNRVRAERSWGNVREEEYVSDDPEITNTYCSRCGFVHYGRSC